MKIIQGKKKPEVTRWAYYWKALSRFYQKNAQKTFQEMYEDGSLIKFIYLNIKAIGGIHGEKRIYTVESVERDYTMNSQILQAIGMLTPKQLMQCFPPDRSYDGKKYGCKDCFSSLRAIAKMEPDKPIGEEDAVIDLLWDYHNWELDMFMVEFMITVSRMRQLDGHPGLMEEFLQDQGVDTYTFHEREGYVQNNRTGEVSKIVKPKKRTPKYLKVHSGYIK